MFLVRFRARRYTMAWVGPLVGSLQDAIDLLIGAPNHAGHDTPASAVTISDICEAAAVDFNEVEGSASRSVYAQAFGDFIHQLRPVNQSTLLQAFANSLETFLTADFSGRRMYNADYTGPLVTLTHAAALDQAFVGAFRQVGFIVLL